MDDTQKNATLERIAERRQADASGFTLIQLALVMVIIGLVAAGVVAGNEMIKQARLRKQITQIDKIEAGIQNFRVKYGCYPGDCADPTVINGYTYAGNGDGYLEAAWNNDENKGFWLHLSLTNMIDDPLATHSQLAGMKTPVMVLRPQGVINAYGNMAYSQNILELGTTSVSGAFKMVEISSIDGKLDDGLAASGNIRSTGYGSGATTVYAADPIFPLATSNNSGSTHCLSGGVYSASATSDECNMVYILGTN